MRNEKTRRAAAAAVCAGVAAAIALGVFWISFDRDAWLAKSVVDRLAPWEHPETCYAATPDSESYFQSYKDASGAYDNYVYEIEALDANGATHRAVLVSFGAMLEEGRPFLAISVKGTSAYVWEYADEDDLPAAMRDALRKH